jgi:hypothetical protein
MPRGRQFSERAVLSARKSGGAPRREALKRRPWTAAAKTRAKAKPPTAKEKVTPTGLERFADSTGNTAIAQEGGAKSGALGAREAAGEASDDPRLQEIVAAWPGLPEEIRAGMLALVREARAVHRKGE